MVARDVPTDIDDNSTASRWLAARWFPKNGNSLGPRDNARTLHTRSVPQSTNTTTTALQSSVTSYGPLIPRLVAQGMLDSPMFSITLQRDAIQIGGNEGMLSIGQLPPTVESESLTWVSVRGYPKSQGGLNPPSDAPGEVRLIRSDDNFHDYSFVF